MGREGAPRQTGGEARAGPSLLSPSSPSGGLRPLPPGTGERSALQEEVALRGESEPWQGCQLRGEAWALPGAALRWHQAPGPQAERALGAGRAARPPGVLPSIRAPGGDVSSNTHTFHRSEHTPGLPVRRICPYLRWQLEAARGLWSSAEPPLGLPLSGEPCVEPGTTPPGVLCCLHVVPSSRKPSRDPPWKLTWLSH